MMKTLEKAVRLSVKSCKLLSRVSNLTSGTVNLRFAACTMPEMVKKIGTHDGSFHCDEVLACFMLKLLPEYKDAVIVRSRDLSVLDTCDVVVDVGQKYDPSKHRYDHHMRDFKESVSTVINKPGYNWTIKLSSAGLIYCHFGLEIIRKLLPEVMNEADIERIFKKIYDSFIKEIDGIDNGVPMFDGEPVYNIETGLSSRVGKLNPPWNDKSTDVEKQFHKAMSLAGEEFVDFVKAAANIWLPARHIVQEAIEKRYDLDPSGEIIELCPAAPWREHLFNIEEEQKIEVPIKYIIFKDDNYRVQMVPVAPRSFVGRMPLPEAWAGLRDEELCKVTGIDGCVFVHTARFIGGNRTREGALEMAKKALKIGHSIC